jgi:thioredoxin 1
MAKLFYAFLISVIFTLSAAAKEPTKLSSGAELALALRSGMLTVVEFMTEGCHNCKAMEPVIKSISKKYAGKVNIITVDLGNDEKTATMYHIASVPVQLIFNKNGKEIKRHFGEMEEKDMVKIITSLITQ